LWARQSYPHQDIRWQHHYADITSWSEGRMLLDYEKFHDVVSDSISDPDGASAAEPAKEQV
jgi:hypothetical protein